jgi:hypothetical protein
MRLYLGATLEAPDAPVLETESSPAYCSSLGEVILSFRLDPGEAQSIEPNTAVYLAGQHQRPVHIPAGEYLFTQRREYLDQAAWLYVAIELQKDSLWERHILEPVLYVRYLFEDEAIVTQVFRPVKKRHLTQQELRQ